MPSSNNKNKEKKTMKNKSTNGSAKKTMTEGKHLAVLSVFAGSLLLSTSSQATVAYSYENDNKTLVATVTDNDTDLTTRQEDAAKFAGITSFVKRGDKNLNVWGSAVNSYTGDIRIENGGLLFYGNALGVNNAQGEIQIVNGSLIQNGNNQPVTFAKDIVFGSDGGWEQDATTIDVYAQREATSTGKIKLGNRNHRIRVYGGSVMNIAGGVEDSNPSAPGYLYVESRNGGTVNFTGSPVKIANQFNFSSSQHCDQYGYNGYITFSVAGNIIPAIGWYNNGFLQYYELKTTVDLAFNNSSMAMYFGNDSKLDLCGTQQRVGHFYVAVATGNPSVITNSLSTPATLYVGGMHKYGSSASAADLRIGGNLSVVYEGDNTTTIDREMTADGDLTLAGSGTLAFTANGSWPNTRNVTVSGSGKMSVANPNAFCEKANLSLASKSSLEIASGVTLVVRTLTINGVQQPNGNYSFGDGTLRVAKPGLLFTIY